MEPKIYLSGNGGAHTIYANPEFDTATIWGETLHNNLKVLTWEQFRSYPDNRQISIAFQLLDRMDNADVEPEPNPYQIEAIGLCQEAQKIEGSPAFNGKYPSEFQEQVLDWLKRFISHCQAA